MERSRGVKQRELTKRLEVSRWTIQQSDRYQLGGNCTPHSNPVSKNRWPVLLRPNGP